MTDATRTYVENLIRLGKGVIVETEKWLAAQPSCNNVVTPHTSRPAAVPAPKAITAPCHPDVNDHPQFVHSGR